MSELKDYIQLLATLGSALGVFVFLRSTAKKGFEELKTEILEIKKDVKNIDSRLSRLEGSFDERGKWESRKYGG